MAKSKKKAPAKKPAAKKAKPAARKTKATPAKAKVKSPAVKKSKPASKAKPAPKAKAMPKTKAAPKTKVTAKGKSSPPAKAKKPAPAAPAPTPVAAKSKAKPSPSTMEKSSKKRALRSSILARKGPGKPIGFTLDDVRAIAKTNTPKADESKPSIKGKSTAAAKALAAAAKPAKPSHIKAASLADILGFNPSKPSKKAVVPSAKPVPEKFKRYYKLLLDLREHLTGQIDQHSEETLKRSSKDDAGDLSSYGQHMADAGTDTFDRDFALSLVSSEQEALSEIEAAIQRIYDGTYGVCEGTGKPIAKNRLLAVPFTRYSAEAQKEIERNRHRVRTQAGLFGELGDDTGKMMDVDDGND
ncbi:MAG: TraR/DksA family transcriptional regulator [Cephaloticoccus sp.]